jgi:hypothetical protein
MSRRNENAHLHNHKQGEHNQRNLSNTHHLNNYNLNKPKNGKVIISSTGGASVYADSSPAPTMDEDNRNGWLFKKTVADASKFNYYFYGEGNKALTLGDLKGMNAIIAVDRYDNTASIPFFVVYTKMTGVGDAGAWYHSKKAYAFDNTPDLQVGELCEVYSGIKPAYKGYRQIQLKAEVNTGDLESTEEIYTMTIQSDSGSAINTKILVQSVGFDAKDISRNIELSS